MARLGFITALAATATAVVYADCDCDIDDSPNFSSWTPDSDDSWDSMEDSWIPYESAASFGPTDGKHSNNDLLSKSFQDMETSDHDGGEWEQMIPESSRDKDTSPKIDSDAPPSSMRVRKSWYKMTEEEQNLYLGAVQKAMEAGLHFRFTKIHSEKPTFDHAHNNCGFLLWHRRFLLGYENMLRDQGPEYADVTIPYWNYFEDSDKQLSPGETCNSLLTCSRFLQDFGGSGNPGDEWNTRQTVANRDVEGICVSSGVAGYACNDPDGENCDQRCIIRGDWDFNGNFIRISRSSITGMVREVFHESTTSERDAHEILSDKLEGNFHLEVHLALGGIMMTAASPYDPVFYSHHAVVDAIDYLHNRCSYDFSEVFMDDTTMSEFKMFSQCQIETDDGMVTITPDSDIVMMYEDHAVDDDPVLGKYFQSLGTKYNDFGDAHGIVDQSGSVSDDMSFRYEMDDYFESLLTQKGVTCPTWLFSSGGTMAHKMRQKKHKMARKMHKKFAPTKEEEECPCKKKERDCSEMYAKAKDDANPQSVESMVATLTACGQELTQSSSKHVTAVDIDFQESLLECETIRQKAGVEFEDYSQYFREQFKIAEHKKPYCYEALRAVGKGEVQIEFSEQCCAAYSNVTDTHLDHESFGKDLAQLPLPPYRQSTTNDVDCDMPKTSHKLRISVHHVSKDEEH